MLQSNLCKSVLVVDNDKLRRIATSQILEEFGFKVVCAESSSDAVNIYELDPAFDIVTIQMGITGGINARTTTRLIRSYQVAKRPYIVGLSTSNTEVSNASTRGMDLLVNWPFDANSSTLQF